MTEPVLLPAGCWWIDRDDCWEITHHPTREDAEADHADRIRGDYGYPLSVKGAFKIYPGEAKQETLRCYEIDCPECGETVHVTRRYDICGACEDDIVTPAIPYEDPDQVELFDVVPHPRHPRPAPQPRRHLPGVVMAVPTLITTIGPAGAGKTTLRRACRPHLPYVSLDENRAQLAPCGCSNSLEHTPAAVEMAVQGARSVLAAGGTVWWDATNADRAARATLLVLAAEYEARTATLVLVPPLLTTLAQNQRRDDRPCLVCGFARRVPEAEVWRMHQAIAADLPTLPDEGWHWITYVTVPAYCEVP
ncbi:AAA family ATPase [Amycolatopsis thailandensis]|uniref:AAA family ATPase n=1 Tax=Amycolatopsis thailandensis TaxID=589330 RepID=UPI00364C356B